MRKREGLNKETMYVCTCTCLLVDVCTYTKQFMELYMCYVSEHAQHHKLMNRILTSRRTLEGYFKVDEVAGILQQGTDFFVCETLCGGPVDS